MENYLNSAADVQVQAVNNETTETGTMSNVRVVKIKKKNFEILVNSICDDLKPDIIDCINYDHFDDLDDLVERLVRLTEMVKNLRGEEDEIDLEGLMEVYPLEFGFIAGELLYRSGELTFLGNELIGNIDDEHDSKTVYEFFKSMRA